MQSHLGIVQPVCRIAAERTYAIYNYTSNIILSCPSATGLIMQIAIFTISKMLFYELSHYKQHILYIHNQKLFKYC